MSPEKRAKSVKNKNDEVLPFDIYRTRNGEKCNDSADLSSKTHVTMNSNNVTDVMTNECDEDDEEDFISKYLITKIRIKT